MKRKNIVISFKNRPYSRVNHLQEIVNGPDEETAEIPPRNLIEEQKALRRAAAWRRMFHDEPQIYMN